MDQAEAVRLLSRGDRGIAEWNLRRAEVEAPCLDGADLSRRMLRRINLSSVSLCGADLSGSDLRLADLSLSNLESARLRSTILRRAHLGDALLRGVDAEGCDLDRVNAPVASFEKARLQGANFRGANLYRSSFAEADLRDSNLRGANLRRCDLGGADFRGADLAAAKFIEANLDGLNLGGALTSHTLFASDLSGAIGLESVSFQGPSQVTLSAAASLSSDQAVAFLKGCGVPDQDIKHFTGRAEDEFYSCFISYSAKDESFAKRLHRGLQDAGVRCWFAPEDMKIGDRTMARIAEAIRDHDKLVLILSEASIDSDWVEHEVARALAEEASRPFSVLLPIRLDNAVMRCEFGWSKRLRQADKPTGRHIGDFTKSSDAAKYQASLERLLRDLRRPE